MEDPRLGRLRCLFGRGALRRVLVGAIVVAVLLASASIGLLIRWLNQPAGNWLH
jgi:hypothetical protein